ncbi:MAG: hypothetical protein ACOX09_08315 [Candidatus Kapaibacterium sp.]
MIKTRQNKYDYDINNKYTEVCFRDTKEQISEVKKKLKIYNFRLDKKLKEKKECELAKYQKFDEIFQRYEIVRNYIENNIVPQVNRLKDNRSYELKYIDNLSDTSCRDVSRYFKVIITHIALQTENSIEVSFDAHAFIITIQKLGGKEENEFITITVPIRRFTKTYMRNVLLNYMLDIINSDTL